ncbi:peptidase associated/transthyretin-like domain-containing protein [Winogradskyella endarachnes]|uniref:Carboxypeptidase regulatory-like domain-containing protein n=1 Tax=Winogradskyella endarachnes TaxID=2681965 RepID=A0A6L6U6G5_9FLAO|nr:hypothetical protein [Winogradskyella endarachnes]MUU77811.1 hypothetical protein [Winogradskyella endarachnes]
MTTIKKLPNFILSFLFALITITSCEKDDGSTGSEQQEIIPDTFSEYFGNEISRNFLGNVIDINNNPIEGVTISIGNETATTDSNGIFIINDANVNERFGYIKAEKAGYIHGSRSVVPSGGTNKVTIMLLEATVAGTVTSGAPETISIANGSSVSFDGNFIKEDGSTYSGSVDVIMHHLDPADDNMALQMPGMLYAQNEEGAERMLQTLGMLAVELRGSSGEDLNLATGSTSEIKIPVDASLMSTAPTTIPLWYFDETNGYWKEEGQATLQGNMYVGTVSHFSFWNLDAQFPAVNLCITLIDQEGNPLANQSLTLTHSNPNYLYPTSSGYSNDVGEVCGLIPLDEVLELNVYMYSYCGNTPIHTEQIGPFNADSNLTVTVTYSSDVIEETVFGNFNTCDDNAVTDGYVQLRYGYQTFTDVVSDGTFEINLLRCEGDNTFGIKGSDYVNLQTTDSISYTFTTPLTNIGTVTACNSVTEFIQYTIDDNDSVFIIDGIQSWYAEVSDASNAPSISISGNGNSTGNNTCFYMMGVLDASNYEGTYDNFDWNNPNDTGFNIQECMDMSNSNNNIIYNLTSFGAVGEYIDINFSGTYEDLDGGSHTINGIVHVLRDN